MLKTGKNVVFTCLIFCKNAVVLIFVSLNLGEQTNQPKKLSSPKLIKMLSAICLKLFSRTSSVNKIHVLNLKLKKERKKERENKIKRELEKRSSSGDENKVKILVKKGRNRQRDREERKGFKKEKRKEKEK